MGRHKKEEKSKYDRYKFRSRLNISAETRRGIAVLVFLGLAIIFGLSLVHAAGSLGRQIAFSLLRLFGIIAYVVPLVLFFISISLFRLEISEKKQSFYLHTYLGAFLFIGGLGGLIHVFVMKDGGSGMQIASSGTAGGYIGALFGQPLFSLFDFLASFVVLLIIMVIGSLVAFNISLRSFWPKKTDLEVLTDNSFGKLDDKTEIKINSMGKAGFTSEKVLVKNKKLQIGEEGEEIIPASLPVANIQQKVIAKTPADFEPVVLSEHKDWKMPSLELLDDTEATVDSGNIEANVAIIRKTLSDFGIDAEMGEVNVGPTVTQYTLRPAAGIRLSQIAALSDNFALSLAAHSIRMELPIPGKALVGIEVPNKATAIVRLRDVLQTKDFFDHKSKLAIALGRDVAGQSMVVDLAKMPHLLIAGATGTGKSVSINSLFISLLFRNTPQDTKFIVIDPKRVELNLYNGIPHLLTPVITEHDQAVNSLKWAVAEMDRRYRLLSENGKRNITEYNASALLKMYYIVIIVDELADLMAVAQADVEAAIVRLAQMARAVGIHLVVATQRPSVDIITGLIKANITSRIAFAVASQIDSRTILDSGGAEKLLGNGDMLYVSAEFNRPKRIQGAFVGEKEVKKVVDYFKSQAGAVLYNSDVVEKQKKPLGVPGFEGEEDGEDDPLLQEASQEVRRAGKASASLLQRRLRIGYARAARILDILEAKGIIGPGEGAKPREVYGAIPAAEKAEYGIGEDE